MADGATATCGDPHTEAWQDKPWKHFQRVVFRLQKRIYQAQQRHDRRTVHKLQRLLLASSAARHFAVRRVTQENRGERHCRGGWGSVTPTSRAIAVGCCTPGPFGSGDPSVGYVPKPGKHEQRPLGIPHYG